MDLFNLVAKITLDSSEYNKKIGDAESKAKSFGGKLKSGLGTAAKVGGAAVAAVGAASVALTKKMVDGAAEAAAYGDNIDKMSQKLGLSAKAYQEWDYVMQISGTEMSSMSTGLKTLTNQFDAAKNGSDKAKEMFNKLGLSMEEIQGLSREELFGTVISSFQNMEDSAERAALANDLFGKSGQELAPLFNTSAEETKNLINQVNQLGGVMSDDSVKAAAAYQDSLTSMKTALSGLKRNIMGEFMPSLTTVMDGISELFTTGGTEKISTGIKSFVGKIGEAIPKVLEKGSQIMLALSESIIVNLPQLVKSATSAVLTFAQGLLKQLPMVIDAGIQLVFTVADGIIDALPELIPSVVSVILTITKKLTDPDMLSRLIDASVQIVSAISTGLIDNLPELLGAAWDLCVALVDAIIHYDWITVGKKIFNSIKNAIKGFFTGGSDEADTPSTAPPQPHGRHASGLKYVPFDEYHAVLHRGERVLTAKESKEYEFSRSKPVVAVENNAESVKVMQEMLEELRATRQDMYTIILSALRSNSEGFSVSERDMARLVKHYAFT